MHKEITRLAFPNILSNISVPLLSTVDIALMGYISTAHVAAIGIASMLFNFIYWNMGFLRISTTGILANAYGENNKQKSSNAFSRSLLLALFLSVLILIFKNSLFSLSLWLFNSNSTQLVLIEEYYNYRIWAAPAALASIVMMGSFFGLQNTKTPLLITIIINALNIVGNYLTVKHYGMGIQGVALSTVLSQYIGCIIGYILLVKKYKAFLISTQKKWIQNWKQTLDLLTLNQHVFIRTFLLTMSFVLFYRFSNNLGTHVLAANTILLQLVNWMSFGVDGFAHASEAIVGKYNGMKDRVKVLRAITLTFYWGMGFAILFSIVYGLFQWQIIGLFTNEQNLHPLFVKYYPWMILLPILATPCYMWDGIYVGFKAGKSMRDSMILAFVAYLIGLYSLIPILGNHALWLSLTIFLVGRSVFQWLLYIRNKNNWMTY